jgi:hypothetical protein
MNTMANIVEFKRHIANSNDNLLENIATRTLDGFIIREFCPPCHAIACGQALIDNPDLLESNPTPYGRIYTRTIIGTKNQLLSYFDDAALFISQWRQHLSATLDFEQHLKELLLRIAGGRGVLLPTNSLTQKFSPFTIRLIESGGNIAVHTERDYFRQATLPDAFWGQISLLKPILSFFMVLRKPTYGGELVIYPEMKYSSDVINSIQERPAADDQHSSSSCYSLSEGDLIVFNAGDLLHCITAVQGSMSRLTIGGFIAYSADDTSLFYFS